jgi:predicted NAD/FAD-dependent oxidoreductase
MIVNMDRKPRPNEPRVAIVGAGIAGLACATFLQDCGFNVSVFEKSRGPSGRMSTRRGDSWQCDHGARYFTARTPEFRHEVARWKKAGVAGLWNPRLKVINGKSLAAGDSDEELYVGVPGMNAPGHFLAKPLSLSTETTIQRLMRMADGWHLFSAEHGWLEEYFDALVLAIPAPQTKALLDDVCADLAELANQAKMRGCWALMLRFPTAIDLPFDAAVIRHGPLGWVARDTSKPGRHGTETWLLQACTEWSEAHLEEIAEDVAGVLIMAFRKLGSPKPQAWTAHRWRYAETRSALKDEYVWQAGINLGLCGDWLNLGSIEGAWLSGVALAKQVAASYSSVRSIR